MSEIEITTSFEMIAEHVIFRVVINNTSENNISNVEVILNFSNSLSKLIGEDRKIINSILPKESRVIEFTFKCPGNFNSEKIGAYIIYYNHKGKKCFASILPQKIDLFM